MAACLEQYKVEQALLNALLSRGKGTTGDGGGGAAAAAPAAASGSGRCDFSTRLVSFEAAEGGVTAHFASRSPPSRGRSPSPPGGGGAAAASSSAASEWELLSDSGAGESSQQQNRQKQPGQQKGNEGQKGKGGASWELVGGDGEWTHAFSLRCKFLVRGEKWSKGKAARERSASAHASRCRTHALPTRRARAPSCPPHSPQLTSLPCVRISHSVLPFLHPRSHPHTRKGWRRRRLQPRPGAAAHPARGLPLRGEVPHRRRAAQRVHLRPRVQARAWRQQRLPCGGGGSGEESAASASAASPLSTGEEQRGRAAAALLACAALPAAASPARLRRGPRSLPPQTCFLTSLPAGPRSCTGSPPRSRGAASPRKTSTPRPWRAGSSGCSSRWIRGPGARWVAHQTPTAYPDCSYK